MKTVLITLTRAIECSEGVIFRICYEQVREKTSKRSTSTSRAVECSEGVKGGLFYSLRPSL